MEFKELPAMYYTKAGGKIYFQFFNTNELMQRYQVFAVGVSFRMVCKYLFVAREDGTVAMFYIRAENEILHGPICSSYIEPSFDDLVEYKDKTGVSQKWDPICR